MAELYIDRRRQTDTWAHPVDESAAAVDGRFTVPLTRWLEQRAALVGINHALGVRLEVTDDPLLLEHDLHRVRLIVVHVPAFTDGRVFSLLSVLRERLGYRGELRVSGDILPDQIAFLERCGANAFELTGPVDVCVFADRYSRYYQESDAHTTQDNHIRRARRASSDLGAT
ncbi:MAG: DUF934 domain-containing protein [Gammaproteobacteria bacterium]